MMTREDRQEALALAYVHAVAAVCGMTHHVPLRDYGIDLTLNDIREEKHQLAESGWAVAVQLKSTTVAGETPTAITYDLTVRAYNALRLPTPTRRILVLGVLPTDENRWVRQTKAKLEMWQSVCWVSLRDRPPVKNRSSIRITIPKRQRFTAAALREIIKTIERGEEL